MKHLSCIILLLISIGFYGHAQPTASQKAQTDSFIKKNNIKPVILAKTTDKPTLFEYDGIEYPPYLEYTYYIYKDAAGKIIKISECPYNENGEWVVYLSHYFDQQGKTIAFERVSTFFNIICSEGIATHTQTEYYNSNFQVEGKELRFVDELMKDLAKEDCQLPVNAEYKVAPTLIDYMKSKKIVLK